MGLPSINDLRLWVGDKLSSVEWNFNLKTIVSWFSDGTADVNFNQVKVNAGLDLSGSKITNMAPGADGNSPITLDQAQTMLNATSNFYPYSIASGVVNSSGEPNYLQKDSDTQLTLLSGGINPDLTVVQSDGTIETLLSNTVLNIPAANGAYNIIKEKDSDPVVTSGKVTKGKVFPTSPSSGDYFLNYSTYPYIGYKYNAVGGWGVAPFVHLGIVSKASGTATLQTFQYIFTSPLAFVKSAMDTSRVISYSWGGQYTTTTDGWIEACCVPQGGGGAHNANLVIDGVSIVISNTGGYGGGGALFVFVPKGTVFSTNATAVWGANYVRFYPCVGS